MALGTIIDGDGSKIPADIYFWVMKLEDVARGMIKRGKISPQKGDELLSPLDSDDPKPASDVREMLLAVQNSMLAIDPDCLDHPLRPSQF